MTDRNRIPHPLVSTMACAALLWLNSCALAPAQGAPPTATADAGTPSLHAAIAEALLAGEGDGAAGADRLLWASNRLAQLGAKPAEGGADLEQAWRCLLYTSPSPRD